MRRIVDIETANLSDTAPADRLCLDHDMRCRRRIVLTTEGGEPVLLDLARPAYLRGGAIVRLDDGTHLSIEAADEQLIEIVTNDTAALVRIAWHLGNRHLPTQLVPGPDGGRLRIRHDHVIRDMATGLGGYCHDIDAPFDPERGAYAAGGTHRHHDDPHDAPAPHRHDHHHHG